MTITTIYTKKLTDPNMAKLQNVDPDDVFVADVALAPPRT